jgi:hypothetical protein
MSLSGPFYLDIANVSAPPKSIAEKISQNVWAFPKKPLILECHQKPMGTFYSHLPKYVLSNNCYQFTEYEAKFEKSLKTE